MADNQASQARKWAMRLYTVRLSRAGRAFASSGSRSSRCGSGSTPFLPHTDEAKCCMRRGETHALGAMAGRPGSSENRSPLDEAIRRVPRVEPERDAEQPRRRLRWKPEASKTS